MDFLTDPHDSGFLAGGLKLNREQIQAVQHVDGPLRIVAGPGTGKTRVIVERIACLIEQGLAKPEDILALTFSRKAADEMRDRLAARLKISYSSFAVSTFHSFCLSAVQDNFWALGYAEPPTLLLATEQWLRVKSMLKEEPAELWPYYNQVLGKDGFVQEVFDFILRSQENLHTQDTLRDIAGREGHDDWLEIINFYGRYMDALRRDNLTDYGGVIFETANLLKNDPDVLAAYQERFKFILVDEYQDTNYAQDEILFLLQSRSRNICVVGDDDQAIHGFRGATVENILHFQKRYGGKEIELRTNYRSVPGIVQTAAEVINANKNRIAKAPNSAREPESTGKPVEGRTFRHYADEAGWITGKISELASSGLSYRDMAVLFRSVKDPLAGLIYDKLRAADIPVRLTGATGELYSHPVVKRVLDLIRFISNRELSDSVLLADFLRSDIGGVGPFAVRLLRRESLMAHKNMYDYIRSGAPGTEVDSEELLKAGVFVDTIGELLEQDLKNPAAIVFAVWSSFGYFTRLVKREGKNNLEEQARRETLANLSRFVDDVKRFTERNPKTTISEYLGMVEAGRFADVPNADPLDQLMDIVNVMTIHQAKGLEWEVVFMPALVDGFFPHPFSPREIADPAKLHVLVNPTLGAEGQHYEEERRLFYVGLTRAKNKVYLSSSIAARASKTRCQPSRFFEEAVACPEATRVSLDVGSKQGPVNLKEAQVFFRRGLSSEDRLEQALSVYGIMKMGSCEAEQWWENVRTTICEYSPFPGGKLRLSSSQLSCYRECPLKYKFQSFWRLNDVSSVYMSRGTLVHDVLESYHSPGAGSRSILGLLDQHWNDAEFGYRPIARAARKQAENALTAYAAKYPQMPDTVRVETGFAFDLLGHSFAGRIDRIDRLPDGKLRLIDYKTGTTLTREEAKRDLQLGLYALAVEKTPDLAALGEVSEAIYLYVSKNGPAERSRPTGEQASADLLTMLARLTGGVAREIFVPRSKVEEEWAGELDADETAWLRIDKCNSCSWKWLCNNGE